MLKFTVDGQKLELLGDPHVVADSFDFLTGSFKFYSGSDWDLTEKHVFFQLGTGTPYEVTLTNDAFVKTDHVNLTTGTWDIHVVGYDINGATLVERITTNVIQLNVERSGVSEGEPFPPSIIPDVLVVLDQTDEQTFENGVPKLAADRVISDDHHVVDKAYVDAQTPDLSGVLSLDQTTPQTFVGGIPKLPADRVIDEDNELADKKFVEDTVATVTRDSLGLGKEDTVTFANLTGNNTGDQDVSGAISTHNTDAGSHANLSRKTETMRLLISRTIGAGENVSAITWTQDDAGNGLALIDVDIRLYVPANSIAVGTTGYIRIRFNDYAGASDYVYSSSLVSALYATHFRSLFGSTSMRIALNGSRFIGLLTGANSDGATQTPLTIVSQTAFASASIAKIHMYINASGLTSLPDGTTINIYGRTA